MASKRGVNTNCKRQKDQLAGSTVSDNHDSGEEMEAKEEQTEGEANEKLLEERLQHLKNERIYNIFKERPT